MTNVGVCPFSRSHCCFWANFGQFPPNVTGPYCTCVSADCYPVCGTLGAGGGNDWREVSCNQEQENQKKTGKTEKQSNFFHHAAPFIVAVSNSIDGAQKADESTVRPARRNGSCFSIFDVLRESLAWRDDQSVPCAIPAPELARDRLCSRAFTLAPSIVHIDSSDSIIAVNK